MKRFLACLVVALGTFSGATAAGATDGDLDITWGDDGFVEATGWDPNWVEVVSP